MSKDECAKLTDIAIYNMVLLLFTLSKVGVDLLHMIKCTTCVLSHSVM